MYSIFSHFVTPLQNLYVKGWAESRTEDDIRLLFEPFGGLEKVKKINNYSFIHFLQREDAVKGNDFILCFRIFELSYI